MSIDNSATIAFLQGYQPTDRYAMTRSLDNMCLDSIARWWLILFLLDDENIFIITIAYDVLYVEYVCT